uniref:IdtS n=1 Tax=Aciculosporium take TaxID=42363 RepID=J7FID8_9HYPO|nr:IdtS [Aciculosporium take]
MAAGDWLFSILQVLLILVGAAWKAREGFPIMDFLGSSDHALPSVWKDKPWFALHLILYIGQMIGLCSILLREMVPNGNIPSKIGYGIQTFVASAYLSRILGLSTALPLLSLWTLHRCRRTNQSMQTIARRSRSEEEVFLSRVFWFSTLTHIGPLLVAVMATFAAGPESPYHLSNSFLGVPDCSQLPCSQVAQKDARLRQINEVTGTSGGFFLTLGLFCQVLGAKGTRLGWRRLTRVFFVSLIAGPAAGGADVLLLRDSFVRVSRREKKA